MDETNIEIYAREYDKRFKNKDDEHTEKEMKKWLKENRYLGRKEFIKIGLWKSKRPRKLYESIWNDDSSVREITQFSFMAKSELVRVKSLFALEGVSYPVASAILHFAFPNRYPILDFRVISSLGWEQPTSYNFGFWQKYCKRIRDIAQEFGEDIRTVDKALWEFSKSKEKQ